MAFDVNNPAHKITLRDEQSIDPILMGYAAVDGDTTKTLDLFNNADKNVQPISGAKALTAKDLVAMIFEDAVNAQDQFSIQSLLEVTSDLNSDISDFRATIGLINTFATAITNHVRPLNRVEVLFAELDSNGVMETVMISKTDWFAARDYVGV